MIRDKSKIRIPYALSVYDQREIQRVVKVFKEHRTNMGIETAEFEEKVAKHFGKKFGIMVNSGSSANYLAIEILDIPPGSEIITPILTFSTTVAPIVKNNLIPVFVDVEQGKYTINTDKIEQLISPKTKALMIPLLLGNVPDMKKLSEIAKKYNLFFIEDSCDALGAIFDKKPTGFYSDISTTSFFGSHIITAAGNGGMLIVNNSNWKNKAKVLRGWGRSSSLFSESENISKRFNKKIDSIPYDAKFIFEDVGYNFLPSEIGAAFGNEQLKKLSKFRQIRENNFQTLYNFFSKYKQFFILPLQDSKVKTQWLAFPLTIKEDAPFSRLEIVTFLEKNNVQTRPIFTGNILRQPGFKDIVYRSLNKNFPIANQVMEQGFLIGCHHGLKNTHLKRLKELFEKFLNLY